MGLGQKGKRRGKRKKKIRTERMPFSQNCKKEKKSGQNKGFFAKVRNSKKKTKKKNPERLQ